MMDLKVLNSRERKKFWQQLNEQFDCEAEDKAVLSNKEKIYLVNNDIHEIPEIKLYYVGLYFCKIMKEGLRPTIEGSQLIAKTAKKNILELNNKQINQWVKGEDMEGFDVPDGFYLVKNKEDIYGCCKIKEGRLFNYVPKGRRLINIHE